MKVVYLLYYLLSDWPALSTNERRRKKYDYKVVTPFSSTFTVELSR